MSAEGLAAIGLAVLTVIGGVVALVVGETAMGGAQDAVFRRPSFASRRQRHRSLMRAGYLCGVLAFFSWFMWLAVVTSDSEDRATDARMFFLLGILFAIGTVVFLTAWWRRAGRPPR